MSRKDMIIEYCFMYIDLYGKFPDTKKFDEYSELEMKQVYLTMKDSHSRLMDNFI
jgi:hypothetical protein